MCQFPLRSGGVCGSTWRVEIDHVHPRAAGGPSTIENCRIACGLCRERHNAHYADCHVMPRRDLEALRPRRSRFADAA
jgi:5-methylcytosine-specific restriction endonuclease McrA